MTYTAKTADALRKITGLLLDKLADEHKLIDTELALHKSKFLVLTPTGSTLAGSGVDLASGSNIGIHGFFFPVDITLVKMHDYLTEVYAKGSFDAKIEIYAEDGTPTKLFGRTLAAGGETAKTHTQTNPEIGKENVATGMGIYLQTTDSSSNGTGHAAVMIEYIER